MHLKSIHIAGFKSFVETTKIDIHDNISAIVGPNGCGKSNIIDAIRWVLGEISMRHLRGENASDVIFNGTQRRRMSAYARVELIFEQSETTVARYAPFQELSIQRKMTRDGQSEYFLNKQPCRRRDITELFLGTGLGKRGYAIIEQGMISRLIEAKPDQLRDYLEEAAGISQYKERRRETEQKIQRTKDNLNRVNDIRFELNEQVEHLHVQAKKATHYRALKKEQRQLESLQASYLWLQEHKICQKLKQQSVDKEHEIENIKTKKTQCELTYAQAQETIMALRQQEQAQSDRLIEVNKSFSHIEQQKRFDEKQLAANQQAYQKNNQEIESLEQSLLKQAQQQSQLNEQWQDHQSILTAAQETQQQCVQAYRVIERQVSELLDSNRQTLAQERRIHTHWQKIREQLTCAQTKEQFVEQELQRAYQDAKHHQTQCLPDVSNVKQEAEQLAQQEQDLAQEKRMLDALCEQLHEQRDQARLQKESHAAQVAQYQGEYQALTQHQEHYRQGYEHLVVDSLSVDKPWRQAMDILLSHVLNQPVDEQESGFKRLEKPQRYPHVTSHVNLKPWLSNVVCVESFDENLVQDDVTIQLLPDGRFKGAGFECLNVATQQGGLALKSRQETLKKLLITHQAEEQKYQEQEAGLISALKKHTQQQQDVQRMWFDVQLKHRQMVDSLEKSQQQVQGWHLKKDALEQKQSQLHRQDSEIKCHISALNKELLHEAQKLEQQRNLHTQGEERLSVLTREKSNQQESMYQAQQSYSDAQKRDEQLRSQCAYTKQRYQEMQSNLERLHRTNEALVQRMQSHDDHTSDSDLARMMKQKQDVETTLAGIRQSIRDNELEQHALLKKDQSFQKKIRALEEELHRFQMNYARSDSRAQQEWKKISDPDTLPETIEQRIKNVNYESIHQQAKQVTQELYALGSVNFAAIDEYEQAHQRSTHLNQQHDDLSGALTSLHKAIALIDEASKKQFKKTFQAVNHEFSQLFAQVFSGGTASLDMLSKDWLHSGVTIKAQPAGKKNQSISLLSGGEKALTALSLLFAIFKLNPAPFCLLDEVDAPLDDANTVRFCDLISTLASSVQCIFISHNKKTIELANQLIGVTMQEAGVSKLVSVSIERALALAEKTQRNKNNSEGV